jgi:DNA-directed RNA polymerase sigma subunit (sigma70/sigma32)
MIDDIPFVDNPLALYHSAVCEVPPLTREEEIELTLALRSGAGNTDAITRRLVEPNLRIVFDLVMHCGECGVSPLDLMIAGNQALLDSVASYARATHGASFSAHATPHIVKALSETILSQKV